MVQSTTDVITPSIAAAYLETNAAEQRRLNKNTVNNYARMMSEGQWQLNVATIIAYLNLIKCYEIDYVVSFFEQLFFEECTRLDVIRQMRKKLIDDKMSARKMVAQYKTQLLVKTWNCYKEGKDPKVLKWVDGIEEARFFE